MREKCLIISKLCVGLTFYITLCCVVTCFFLCVKTAKKRDKLMREKCLIISKLCVGLTFYITLCV